MMLLDYYGLNEQPFGVTPDPRYLFFSEGHREALAAIYYAIEERRGFSALVAKPGMGKTTLLFRLLESLQESARTAFLFQAGQDSRDFLDSLVRDLGISAKSTDLPALHEALNTLLVKEMEENRRVVVVIDEAQNLTEQMLEQVRLLSNFETTKEKILQIVLVGQPELLARLELPELRQLKQRIGILCTIPAMTHSGTRNYIRTRLRLAGVRDLGIFTEEALARISTQTGGVPRVVNTVCDHCLLIGYADQTRRIDADIVDQALSYLHGGAAVRTRRRTREVSRPRIARRRARRRMNPLAWGVLGASTAVVAAVAAVIWTHSGFVTEALDLSSAQLSDLARSLRSLIGQ